MLSKPLQLLPVLLCEKYKMQNSLCKLSGQQKCVTNPNGVSRQHAHPVLSLHDLSTHRSLGRHRERLPSQESPCHCGRGRRTCPSLSRSRRRSAGCWAGSECCFEGLVLDRLSPRWPEGSGCRWLHTPEPACGLYAPSWCGTLAGRWSSLPRTSSLHKRDTA